MTLESIIKVYHILRLSGVGTHYNKLAQKNRTNEPSTPLRMTLESIIKVYLTVRLSGVEALLHQKSSEKYPLSLNQVNI